MNIGFSYEEGISMNNQTDWLSIIDYSQASGLSISTLRRRIKRKEIEFQEIGGKYFIRCEVVTNKQQTEDQKTELLFLRLEIDKLHRELHQLREENNDLKMLVDIYEREKAESKELPTLPQELPELPVLPHLQ